MHADFQNSFRLGLSIKFAVRALLYLFIYIYYIFRQTLNLSCETEKDKNNSILMYLAK